MDFRMDTIDADPSLDDLVGSSCAPHTHSFQTCYLSGSEGSEDCRSAGMISRCNSSRSSRSSSRANWVTMALAQCDNGGRHRRIFDDGAAFMHATDRVTSLGAGARERSVVRCCGKSGNTRELWRCQQLDRLVTFSVSQ
jgi:hypothetical protein